MLIKNRFVPSLSFISMGALYIVKIEWLAIITMHYWHAHLLISNSVQGIWVVYCKLGAIITTWFFPIMQKKGTRPKYIEAIIVTILLESGPLQHLMVFIVQLKFPLIFLKAASSDKLLAAPLRQSFNLNFNFQTSSWELNWNFLTIISWSPGAISGNLIKALIIWQNMFPFYLKVFLKKIR